MKTLCFLVLVASPLAQPASPASRTPPADPTVHPEEYRERRRRVLELMEREGGGVLLLRARPPARFAGDVEFPYRPQNDFYYLSGIDRPKAALLLYAGGRDGVPRELLFFDEIPASHRVWVGPGLSRDEAAARAGLPPDAVKPLSELDRFFARAMADARPPPFHAGAASPPRRRARLWFDTGRAFGPGELPTEPYAFLLERLGARAFGLDLIPPGRLTHPMRQIKSPSEIACLRRAIEVTCETLGRTLRRIRPGLYEYEIRASIEGGFIAGGCEGWGFPPIIASGPNTCILHYQRYDRRVEDGDLVLLDVGAQFRFYSADVTRTVPATGTFTPRQREIYRIVLDAQKAAISKVRPGARWREVDRAARQVIAEGLKRLGLIREDREVRRYFMHGTSHGLGLAVHDPMPEPVLREGMVITVEPGIYIPEEAIGVRIEDDVLVVPEGSEVLSASVPRAPEEIEAWMRRRRF